MNNAGQNWEVTPEPVSKWQNIEDATSQVTVTGNFVCYKSTKGKVKGFIIIITPRNGNRRQWPPEQDLDR